MRRHIEGTNDLEPIIKWPGGKEKELQQIVDNIPDQFENYYEPFVGGGSVFMAIKANNYMVNDLSTELIQLYRYIQNQDEDFFNYVQGMEQTWTNMEQFLHDSIVELSDIYASFRNDEITYANVCAQIDTFAQNHHDTIIAVLAVIQANQESLVKEIRRNLKDKMKRMKKIEADKGILPETDLSDNIEASLKGSVYMYYRGLYNNREIEKPRSLQTALFFFIRNYAYSGMFRFSKRGDFNVPYGGIAYNSKHLTHKIEYYLSDNVREHFDQSEVFNQDFEEFLVNNPPRENDFIFIDPPYDTEFCTYDNNEFGRNDQERLADYLINRCPGQWMLIIKRTDFIYNLYAGHPNVNFLAFDKEYVVSFMNRNDRSVKHLLITNYSQRN